MDVIICFMLCYITPASKAQCMYKSHQTATSYSFFAKNVHIFQFLIGLHKLTINQTINH